MRKIVVLYDWDGCLVDTMPTHADLAAECIRDTFGIPFDEARTKYLATTGIPFDKQLEKIFPDVEPNKREQCAHRYHQEKIERVYGNPVTFPGTAKTLRGIKTIFVNCQQYISSSTEGSLIRDWAFKNELLPYFNHIYGREEGNKQEHIRLVREKFLDPIIFFVSDSSGDMSLPADCCIGVEVPHNDIQKFFDQGAWRVVLGPINFKDIEHIIESYLKSL